MDQGPVPLSEVCQYWQEFDLDGRRNTLDEAALQAAEFQEETVLKRKQLAHSTRTFKAKVTAELAKAVGPLLKEYQSEVDRLTRRSKHAESAFLDLYQKLYEAPDPVSVLHAAVQSESQLAQVTAQNAKIQKELHEFQTESTAIKNQELTIRKLEDRCKSLEADLAGKEEELRQTEERKETQAKEAAVAVLASREAKLQEQLTEAQTQLSALSRKHRGAQDKLLELQQRQEGSVVGAAADAELANDELDRAQMRVLSLEAENRQLQQRIEAQAAQERRVDPLEVQSLHDDVNRAKRAAASAQEEARDALMLAEEAEQAATAKVTGMQRALAAAEEAQQALQTELSVRPTVQQLDELRQQIQALQALHFGSVDTSGGEGEGTGGAAGLDKALAARVRELEHQVTMSRLQRSEASAATEAAEAEATKLQGELEEARKVIASLEEDLQVAENAAVGQSPTADATPGEAAAGGDHAVLHALCSQRDRFKSKVQELQEALAGANARVASAENDKAATQADNVALVERLRYVSSYAGTAKRAPTLAAAEAGQIAEDKYSREYEKKLDPFSEFKGRVRDTSKAQMPVADKIVYSLGELLFGSRLARLVVVIYIGLMHFLTFSVLASVSHGRHDDLSSHEWHCSRSAAAAALAADELPGKTMP